MRKQVLYGIIAVLLIAVGYLIYALETEKQILKESINELAELQGVMADQSYELENITVISKLQHYAEGRSVDNYTLYSADGDSCKLQDVCKEKKLVYYLSEQGCQICYQPFLEKLNDLADKIGKENIVVIAKFSEKRVFKLFLQDLDFEMKPAVYQCRTDFDIYPEYKATRKEVPPELIPQFSIIREAVKAFNVASVEQEGYEADDLIASYTREALEQGYEVIIVSADKDLMQLMRENVHIYDPLKKKMLDETDVEKKFGVSAQHYSFAVKAFVDMAKEFDMSKYEFAIRETKTAEVISDVSTMKSEIGVLYLSEYNRKSLEKMLRLSGLEFHHLIDCHAYVYLWKNHPLAGESSISFSQLADYPCLAFEQGDNSSFYLAEEILSTNEYPKIIRANDRATMLNLMVGLNGYTLCSGIICGELNGNEFVAVPFQDDEENHNSVMEIGYIVRKNTIPGKAAKLYIAALKRYLGIRE